MIITPEILAMNAVELAVRRTADQCKVESDISRILNVLADEIQKISNGAIEERKEAARIYRGPKEQG